MCEYTYDIIIIIKKNKKQKPHISKLRLNT